MKVLLDTHAILWWFAGDSRLTEKAADIIGANENEVWVSTATAWEIATKHRLGKLGGVQRLLADFDHTIREAGFKSLPITNQHALLAGGFNAAHRDPFDRMLAAQALCERATLISNDPAMHAFGVDQIW